MEARGGYEAQLLEEIREIPDEMIPKIIRIVHTLKKEFIERAEIKGAEEEMAEGMITPRRLPGSLKEMVESGEIKICNASLASPDCAEPEVDLETFQSAMRGRNIPVEKMIRQERSKR